ncbi:MAG: glycoside hydrolase family 3 C-terminal domain-containing protein [Clostridia bacterium]|nr:glycoside hydrolase family 3 C-terminal domain-containing protein [Clostridia bacterium]
MDRALARQKAAELVSKMTVEEAASQLRFDAPAIDRLGVPAYNWWNEALHGVARAGTATSFPQAIALAAAFDPDMVQTLGDVAATEGRAKYNAASAHGDRDIYKGLTFWSPNVNIFRDPRWGRGHETYGEDPFLTAELGKAYVRGLQGEGDVLKSGACAKHFAVHSGPEALRHRFNAVATKKDMAETYLPAFKALVQEAKVESVMGAYNRTNGEPCCGSKALMVDLLRGEWGFEGHYVSDCWAIADFHTNHKVTDSPEESAALALEMGCDVNCGNTYVYMMKAYEKGLVTEEQIRTAAIRLFTTRYLLGIMGEGSEYDKIPYTAVEQPSHLAEARRATEKTCVLLKNDGILPLDMSKIKTLGVIGPNADSRVALIGNYHGTSSRYVTVLEGLQDAVGEDVRVLYAQGCHLFREKEENLGMADDRISEALTVAEASDAVVLVVGLDETLEGEEGDTGNAAASGDKMDLLLPAPQRKLMDAVLATGKPTVICLMAGSSIDLGEAGEKANGVLLTWYPGARGGKSVADILLGKVSPSGKLPLTFYRNEQLALMPEFTDYAMTGRTYRYFEHEPLYPFGYGLTYGDTRVTAATAGKQGEDYVIRATVRNDGGVDTEDVVQVYVQNEGSANAPKHPRLCGFLRVKVPAGAEIEAEIPVAAAPLLVVNDSGEAVAEGTPVFYAGMNQPDALSEKLTGHKCVKIAL